MTDEKGDMKIIPSEHLEVVNGNDRCHTYTVKWLCLENIHHKMHRPNMYDIGGTYELSGPSAIADYWFMYMTDQINENFLLHLFICNKHESSFKLGLSYSSDILLDRKSAIARLPDSLNYFNFTNIPENTYSYLTTYNFSDLDVENLKSRNLHIAIKFCSDNEKACHKNLIDAVKASHDFGALLDDPVCSDFTIESADGHKFKVHKLILSAHSEVFKAMLKDDTAESQNRHVKMVDVSKEDLQCILQFIYTGTIQDLMDCNCINLLMLADKYDLRGLVTLTENALRLQLSLDTAAVTLVVADMYNSCFLKTKVMEFIKKNPSVMKTQGWKEIKNADLIRELCEYLASDD